MSVDVDLIVVKKEGNVPWAAFYLGGNGTQDALRWGEYSPIYNVDPIVNCHNDRLWPLRLEQVLSLLSDFEDDFYADHDSMEARAFLNGHFSSDDFVIFLRVS